MRIGGCGWRVTPQSRQRPWCTVFVFEIVEDFSIKNDDLTNKHGDNHSFVVPPIERSHLFGTDSPAGIKSDDSIIILPHKSDFKRNSFDVAIDKNKNY